MSNPQDEQEKTLARYSAGPEKLMQVLSGIDETQLDTSQRQDSWTIRQIVHHLADGDDLWGVFIKQAIGNPGSEFSLSWYGSQSQDEWVESWKYSKRDIEPSLALFRATRENIGQLLASNPDVWSNNLTVLPPKGESVILTIREVVEMQAYHLEHHISAIQDILRGHEK